MSKYNPPFNNLKENAKGLFPLGLTLACALTLIALESSRFYKEQSEDLIIINEDEFPIELELNKDIIFHEDLMKKKKKSAKIIKPSNEPIRKPLEIKPMLTANNSLGNLLPVIQRSNLGLNIDTAENVTLNMGELQLDGYPYFESCFNPDNPIEQFKCTRLKLQHIIRDNVKYPQIDKMAQSSGTVVIGFTINKYGEVSDMKITRSVSKSMDQAALRSLYAVPDFVPGKQNGRPINVRFQVPITFKNQ